MANCAYRQHSGPRPRLRLIVHTYWLWLLIFFKCARPLLVRLLLLFGFLSSDFERNFLVCYLLLRASFLSLNFLEAFQDEPAYTKSLCIITVKSEKKLSPIHFLQLLLKCCRRAIRHSVRVRGPLSGNLALGSQPESWIYLLSHIKIIFYIFFFYQTFASVLFLSKLVTAINMKIESSFGFFSQ